MHTQHSLIQSAKALRRGDRLQLQAPRLRVPAVRDGVRICLAASISLAFLSVGSAQQLLDQVAARVGTTAITRTDVDAATAFGVVSAGQGDPLQQVIDRRLMLAEVDKFKPADPADADVAALVGKMKASAGSDVNAVMKRTGVDDRRLTELARDTLRLQAYLAQRFGTGTRSDQQIARWVEDLRTRGDVTLVNRQR
jgi:hypothetical protein